MMMMMTFLNDGNWCNNNKVNVMGITLGPLYHPAFKLGCIDHSPGMSYKSFP